MDWKIVVVEQRQNLDLMQGKQDQGMNQIKNLGIQDSKLQLMEWYNYYDMAMMTDDMDESYSKFDFGLMEPATPETAWFRDRTVLGVAVCPAGL